MLNDSYKILSNWMSNPKNYQHLLGNEGDGETFVVDGISVTKDDVSMMVSDEKKSSKNNYIATKKCYNYNKMGYISCNCPNKNKKTADTGAITDKTPDTTETGTTDRPPDQ